MATKRFRFTQSKLDALPRPGPGKWTWYQDDTQPYLKLAAGHEHSTFYFVKKSAGGRTKLGRYGEITIDEARDAVQARLVAIANGADPAKVKQAGRGEITLQEAWTDAKENRRSRRGGFLSAKTKHDYGLNFAKHLGTWKNRPLASIDHDLISALHLRIGRRRRVTANRVAALLSMLFDHAAKRKLYSGPNPARGIDKFKESSRERYLVEAELPKFLQALAATPAPWRQVFALSLLTGARRSNVLSARWEDFDLDGRMWRIPNTKTGKAVTLPLSAEAIAIIGQIPHPPGASYLFPSHGKLGHVSEPKKAWADLRERSGLPDLRIHDLRRSYASWQATTGSSLPIIGKSLGNTTAQSTAVYARLPGVAVVDSVDRATSAMLAAGRKGDKGKAVRKLFGKRK